MWKQVLKRGKRIYVDGKEPREIVFGSVTLEIKPDGKGRADEGMFHIRLKKKEKPVWDE